MHQRRKAPRNKARHSEQDGLTLSLAFGFVRFPTVLYGGKNQKECGIFRPNGHASVYKHSLSIITKLVLSAISLPYWRSFPPLCHKVTTTRTLLGRPCIPLVPGAPRHLPTHSSIAPLKIKKVNHRIGGWTRSPRKNQGTLRKKRTRFTLFFIFQLHFLYQRSKHQERKERASLSCSERKERASLLSWFLSWSFSIISISLSAPQKLQWNTTLDQEATTNNHYASSQMAWSSTRYEEEQ